MEEEAPENKAAAAMAEEEMGEERGVGGDARRSALEFLYWIASSRRLKPDDPFFAAGNIERELIAKQVALELTEDERCRIQKMEGAEADTVFCPIVGCSSRLDCLEDFEDHYHARHTASCSVCSRVFPTSRLLSIHVSEAHDSFFQAKVARGFPMYECLVDGCGLKFRSYKSLQQHFVDKHKFPASFEFFEKAQPSKRQRKKLLRKQAGYLQEQQKDTNMDIDVKISKPVSRKYGHKQAIANEKSNSEMEVKGKIDDLDSAVSRLSTSDASPSSISFGHRRGMTFVPWSIRQSQKQTHQSEAKR